MSFKASGNYKRETNCPECIVSRVHSNIEWLKNKIFKQGIGIAEKSLETRRDRWGGNVNPKSLF